MSWGFTFQSKRRQLYAVSCDGIGILVGTLSPTRKGAIALFQIDCHEGSFALDWGAAKRAGYRTVRAMIEVKDRQGNARRRPMKPR